MVAENLVQVQKNIEESCKKVNRDPGEVTLIAVSKTKPVEMLQEAYAAGARVFGENKVQEIVDKYDTGSSIYLLPIIKPHSKKDERTQYIYAGHNINRNLKSIGRKLGLSLPLTMYVARHKWEYHKNSTINI